MKSTIKSNKITFDYNYYPSEQTCILLQEELNVHFKIRYINLTVDCIVFPTVYGKLQEDDLVTIEGIHVNYVTTEQEPEIPCMLYKEQRLIISDYIDEQALTVPALKAYQELN